MRELHIMERRNIAKYRSTTSEWFTAIQCGHYKKT